MRELLCLGQICFALLYLVFSSLTFGDLKAQLLIGAGQLCGAPRDFHFKIASPSPHPNHQESKNDEAKVISEAT